MSKEAPGPARCLADTARRAWDRHNRASRCNKPNPARLNVRVPESERRPAWASLSHSFGNEGVTCASYIKSPLRGD